MLRRFLAVTLAALVSSPALGQTPQPFPRPGIQPPATTQVPAADTPQTPPPTQAQTQAQARPAAPDGLTLGFPLYPAAQFLGSYDAGHGQRYFIFGTTAPFAEIIAYYRTQLGTRGNLVFREPPTHMFEVGRFREETMAFPPGVTVKDWTWGGSLGYPNPHLGAQPGRFPTVIMIVPPPPAS